MFELYNLFRIDGRNRGNGTHSILLLPPGCRHNFPRMFDHQRGTRIGPFSSENYRFQDNFLSSPSHAWNMRGPCPFAFGRSIFCVHTSGFSADAHCYRYPLNTSMPKHTTTILCFYSTYFLLIPQTIDGVEHSIRWSVFQTDFRLNYHQMQLTFIVSRWAVFTCYSQAFTNA